MTSPAAKHASMSIREFLESAELSPNQSHMQLSALLELDEYADLQEACDALPGPAKDQSIVGFLRRQVQQYPPEPASDTPSLTPPSSPRPVAASSPESLSLAEPSILPPLLIVDERSAKMWYHDLPSQPRLLATTQTETLKAFSLLRRLTPGTMISPPGAHPLLSVWRTAALALEAQLNAEQLEWTTIDLVRIGHKDKSQHPLVVWIGIKPGTLSLESAKDILYLCWTLLREGFPNVKDYAMEMREATLLLAASKPPPPCKATTSPDNVFEKDYAREYAQTALHPGLRIGPFGNPTRWGTAGFFLRAHDELYVVTCRHVLAGPEPTDTRVILAPGAERDSHDGRSNTIDRMATTVDDYLQHVERGMAMIKLQSLSAEAMLETRGDTLTSEQTTALQQTIARVGETESCIEQAKVFRHFLTTSFSNPLERIIGHLDYSPPISVYRGFLVDFGVVRLDRECIPQWFRGNMIDLNLASFDNIDFQAATGQRYPEAGLIQVRSVLQSSTESKANVGRKVILAGAASGRRVGSLGAPSRIRLSDLQLEIPNQESAWTVPVLPSITWRDRSDQRDWSGVGHLYFSHPGDSGGMVVTVEGDLVGLLLGGCWRSNIEARTSRVDCDISYLCPANYALDVIRSQDHLREVTLDVC